MSHEKTPIFDRFLKYLPLLTAFVLVILMWGNIKNTLSSTVERVNTLEASGAANSTIQNQMLVQLSQIQTDLQWIKAKLK